MVDGEEERGLVVAAEPHHVVVVVREAHVGPRVVAVRALDFGGRDATRPWPQAQAGRPQLPSF